MSSDGGVYDVLRFLRNLKLPGGWRMEVKDDGVVSFVVSDTRPLDVTMTREIKALERKVAELEKRAEIAESRWEQTKRMYDRICADRTAMEERMSKLGARVTELNVRVKEEGAD